MQRANAAVTWDNYLSSDTTAGDGSKNLVGMPTNIEGMAGLSYQFVWTGTCAGTIAWQVSNSYELPKATGTWSTLSAAFIQNLSACQPAGSASDSMIELSGLKVRWIRPIYTRSSGSGTIRAYVSAKAAGA